MHQVEYKDNKSKSTIFKSTIFKSTKFKNTKFKNTKFKSNESISNKLFDYIHHAGESPYSILLTNLSNL